APSRRHALKSRRRHCSAFSHMPPLRTLDRLSRLSLRNVINPGSTHFRTGGMLLIEGSQPVCKTARTAILIASRNARTGAESRPARAPVAVSLRGLAEISVGQGVARLRQLRRRNIGKNASRARDDEMFGFFLADPFRGL